MSVVVKKVVDNPAVLLGALASLFTALAQAAGDGPLTLAAAVPVLATWAVRFLVTPEHKAKVREANAFVEGLVKAEELDSDLLELRADLIDFDDEASFQRLVGENPDEGSTGVQV